MLANAAALAHAAMVTAYQRGMAAAGSLSDAYLTQGARQALTLVGVLDGLARMQGSVKPVDPVKLEPKRSSPEAYRAYHREYARRRSALKREAMAKQPDLRVVGG